MKLSYILTALSLLLSSTVCEAFSVVPNRADTAATTTQLQAAMGRREMVTAAAFSAGALLIPVEAAFAAEYVPKLQDMQQIYFLGASLDNLIKKLSDGQIESALSGVKQFNKDPKFYSGYARNFVLKSVKNNADSDPRVGYVKQASTLIGSIESVLEGGDALMNEKNTTKEAIARVKKAQALIAKFIEESGVEDEKLSAWVKTHK
jgi:hypothetical protein